MSAQQFAAWNAMMLLLLLALVLPAAAQRSCDVSELGYDCVKTLAEYYNLHWTLEDNVVHFALEGIDAQWVGLSFAEEEGMMAPADAVIGWFDVNGPNVRAYRVITQSVFAQDEDNSITLRNVTAVEDDGRTIVAFSRRLGEGNVEIDPQARTLINFAVGETDSLRYHRERRGWDTVRLAATSEVMRNESFVVPMFEAEPPEIEMAQAFAPTPQASAPAPFMDFLPGVLDMNVSEAPAESPLEPDEDTEAMLDELL